jgi:23S rRNA (adenine2503-C2)-methyltransferase
VQVAREAYRPGERLQNIVFMGVGEPMHNLKAVLRALEIFSHPDGIDLSTRRVTLSTVGVKNGIRRLGEVADGKVALAVSLHAADEETRRRLVPGAPDSLDDIISALEQYRLPKRRRITIEYVLVKGINDSGADARALVRRLSKLKVKVNLLPLNPHDKTDLEPPDEVVVERFRQILLDKGMTAILRKRRGADIGAACGQLLSLEPA